MYIYTNLINIICLLNLSKNKKEIYKISNLYYYSLCSLPVMYAMYKMLYFLIVFLTAHRIAEEQPLAELSDSGEIK